MWLNGEGGCSPCPRAGAAQGVRCPLRERKNRRVSSMDSRDVRQGRATPDGFCRVRLNTKRRARACRTEPEKGSDARLQGSWCRGEGITATSPLVMMSGRVAATSPLWMCDGATVTWSVKTQLIISLMYWDQYRQDIHQLLFMTSLSYARLVSSDTCGSMGKAAAVRVHVPAPRRVCGVPR